MSNQSSRTELLIGKDGVEKLQNSKVVVFGIGGVGSYVVEGLARAGIGEFILIDKDIVDKTNINRQIIATTKTIGKPKVDVSKQRILEINPNAKVETYKEFFMPESKDFFNETIDYVIDCVDTITAKIEIIVRAKKHNIHVISSMGTGNSPLAKVMRKELKQRGIESLKVVYSKEEPLKTNTFDEETNKQIPGSISFVPSVAGLIIASEVVKDIIKNKKL